MTTYENLRVARRGPIVSIAAYLLLTIAKLIAGHFLNSSSLIADGFNNLSDILGNVALLIGLQLASQPADSDHRFGHWKIEDLSSLVTSFIMFVVGFQVLIQTVRKIFLREETVVDPLGAAVGVLSAIVMCAVYFYNKGLAKKLKSSALIAAAKDNLSDAVTSIGTSIAIVAASFNLTIIDYITAIIITFFILKTAYDIFMEATFSLSDGFDERNLKAYEKAILNIPKVTKVKKQRGRSYGSNIYLDIVVEMNPDLSVYESHAITEQIEEILSERFSDTDVHVEPAAIPEDEIYGNVLRKLIRNEKIILSKIPGYENLLAPDFFLIDENGHHQNREDVIANHQPLLNNFDKFKMTSISQKTKLISYELGGNFHTSIWRRNETWFMIYHQVTAIKDKE